jgi:hypothetical protein
MRRTSEYVWSFFRLIWAACRNSVVQSPKKRSKFDNVEQLEEKIAEIAGTVTDLFIAKLVDLSTCRLSYLWNVGTFDRCPVKRLNVDVEDLKLPGLSLAWPGQPGATKEYSVAV